MSAADDADVGAGVGADARVDVGDVDGVGAGASVGAHVGVGGRIDGGAGVGAGLGAGAGVLLDACGALIKMVRVMQDADWVMTQSELKDPVGSFLRS